MQGKVDFDGGRTPTLCEKYYAAWVSKAKEKLLQNHYANCLKNKSIIKLKIHNFFHFTTFQSSSCSAKDQFKLHTEYMHNAAWWLVLSCKYTGYTDLYHMPQLWNTYFFPK